MSTFDSHPDEFDIVHGHTDEDSAHVVDDYPYGSQRTQIRYWIETVPRKGDRFCSQTLNPKTGRWNKPKRSTYSPLRFMTLHPQDDGRTFVRAEAAISGYASPETLEAWKPYVKEHGNAEQRKQFAYLLASAKVMQHVTFSVVSADTETPEETERRNAEQADATQRINRAIAIESHHARKEIG